MKIEKTNQIKVKLNGTDADNFKTAIKKIAEENKTIGFNKSKLNDDEIKVIQEISKQVNT